MFHLLLAVFTQVIPFFPLVFAINISYSVLRVTDMSLDGSFVLGAVIFARCLWEGMDPLTASVLGMGGGALTGCCVAALQCRGRIDPLLSGILVAFILASVNLLILGRPNRSLLGHETFLSRAFDLGPFHGWTLTSLVSIVFVVMAYLLIRSRFGVLLRGLGDNPDLFRRLGYSADLYRSAAYAITGSLAALSGILSSQIFGYADTGMGLGMTLTGLCSLLIGQSCLSLLNPAWQSVRTTTELLACLFGVFAYFVGVHLLLRLNLNPIFLKMALGIALIFFLQTRGKIPSFAVLSSTFTGGSKKS